MVMSFAKAGKIGLATCALALASPGSIKADVFPLGGPYNLALSGFGLVGEETVPVSIVGWMTTRLNGSIPAFRYNLNIGGCAIVNSKGSGDYDARGRIGTMVILVDETPPPVTVVPAQSCSAFAPQLEGLLGNPATFELDFVVNQETADPDQVVDIIGVTLTVAEGTPDETPIAFEVHGVARPVIR